MVKCTKNLTMRVILMVTVLVFFAFTVCTYAAPAPIVNNTQWTTSGGVRIDAQGGCLMLDNGTYYWYGVAFKPDHSGRTIECYSSTNLSSWTKVGTVFSNTVTANGVHFNGWVGRPDVIKCPSTGKYIMIIEGNGNTGIPSPNRNAMVFLQCNTATGEFQFVRWLNTPGGYTMGDKGAFKDANGDAYVLFTTDKWGTNKGQMVGKLTTDYLNIASVVNECEVTAGVQKEAMAGVKHHSNGYYYLFASRTAGWLSSGTYYKRATTMAGMPKTGGTDGSGWNHVKKHDGANSIDNVSYNSQHDFIVKYSGNGNTAYMYCGDRWNNWDADVGGTGWYVWYPLTFNSGVPRIEGSTATWQINVANGSWTH